MLHANITTVPGNMQLSLVFGFFNTLAAGASANFHEDMVSCHFNCSR